MNRPAWSAPDYNPNYSVVCQVRVMQIPALTWHANNAVPCYQAARAGLLVSPVADPWLIDSVYTGWLFQYGKGIGK